MYVAKPLFQALYHNLQRQCFQGLTPQMTPVPHNVWLQAQRSLGAETSLLLVYQCQSDSFKRHCEV